MGAHHVLVCVRTLKVAGTAYLTSEPPQPLMHLEHVFAKEASPGEHTTALVTELAGVHRSLLLAVAHGR
jgi:hypothetical protein